MTNPETPTTEPASEDQEKLGIRKRRVQGSDSWSRFVTALCNDELSDNCKAVARNTFILGVPKILASKTTDKSEPSPQ
jgi:hypothetical protein